MDNIFNKNYNNLELRFPKEKYVYGKIPVVFLGEDKNKYPIILQPDDIEKYDKKNIEEFIVVFKKNNWSTDNDLRTISKSFDKNKCKYRFDFDLYCMNAVKYLLVLIIDIKNNNEKFIDEYSIKLINYKFIEGLIYYFLKLQPHQDHMSEEEQSQLSLDIHKYLSYERKKKKGIVQGSIPRCPSIIIEANLMEVYKIPLTEIRKFEPRDITSLNIYMTQLNFEQFASSDAREKFFSTNQYGDMEEFQTLEEAKKKKKLFEIGEDDISTTIDEDADGNEYSYKDKISKDNLNIDNLPINDKEKLDIETTIYNLVNNSEKTINNFFDKSKNQSNIRKK